MRTIIRLFFIALACACPCLCSAQSQKFVVVLDAGHGGHDSGAVGRPTTNREKDINLDITLQVGQLLKQNCPDVQVLYTRNTDVFVTLGGRADIANKAKADLFVSIHTNAIERSPSRQPVGVQSYTLSLKTAGTNLEVEKRENSVIQFEADGEQKYSFANPNSAESDIMFELMQDRDMQESVNFARLAQEEMVKSGGRNDMGVLQANLAVLRLTYMPSVLLEVGFISTPSEERFLMSKEGRTVLAKCIYNAISRYKTSHTGRMSSLEKIDIKSVQEHLAQEEAESAEKAVEETAAETTEASNEAVQETVAAEVNSETAKAKEVKAEEAKPKGIVAADAGRPVFKIQLFAANAKVAANSAQLKGLKADCYEEGGMFKYTYGASTDYNEILKLKKQIADKFKDTFIVAFKDGEKMQLNEAINEWKRKK